MTNTDYTPSAFAAESIAAGYPFECCCGEHFSSAYAASTCKKCRTYSVWGYTKYVTDLRSGEIVYGEEPAEGEFEAALAEAEIRWAEEREELELEMQMWRQEGELYEAEMQRQREEAEQRRAEEEEDILWDEQERLSR